MYKKFNNIKKIAAIFATSLAMASVAAPIINSSLISSVEAEASTFTTPAVGRTSDSQIFEFNNQNNLTPKSNENEENSGSVTIRYVGPTGKDLIYPEVITGKVGDNLNITRKNIGMNMIFQGVDGDLNGKFTSDPQTITFRYTHEPVKFTLVSEDEDHKQIADDIVKIYDESNPVLLNDSMFKKAGWSIDYDASTYADVDQVLTFKQLLDMSRTNDIDELAQFINDQLATNITDTHHVWTNPDVVARVVYKRDIVAGAPLTVKYRDTKGNKIADDDQFQGNVGQVINLNPKDIDHYIWISGSTQSTISDTPTEITLTYQAQKGADVTVKYVDENGTSLMDSKTLSGNYNDSYISSREEINGYQLESIKGTENGTFDDKSSTITYIYKKILTDAAEGLNSGDKTSSVHVSTAGSDQTKDLYTTNKQENKGFLAAENAQNYANTQSNELPSTGMNKMTFLTTLGLSIVLFTAILIFRHSTERIKHDKK